MKTVNGKANLITATNKLNNLLNVIALELKTELAKGYKFNQGGDFDKRTTDRLEKIINSKYDWKVKDKGVSIYLDTSYSFSKGIKGQIRYDISEHGNGYYRNQVDLLYNDGESGYNEQGVRNPKTYNLSSLTHPLPTKYTVTKTGKTRAQIRGLNTKIKSLNDQISKLKRTLPMYGDV